MLAAALAIAVLMVATWLLSLVLRNASIVDVAWGLGFVVVAWTVRLTAHGDPARQNLLTALVTVWAFDLVRPYAFNLIGEKTLSDIAAGVVLFVAALVVFSLVAAYELREGRYVEVLLFLAFAAIMSKLIWEPLLHVLQPFIQRDRRRRAVGLDHRRAPFDLLVVQHARRQLFRDDGLGLGELAGRGIVLEELHEVGRELLHRRHLPGGAVAVAERLLHLEPLVPGHRVRAPFEDVQVAVRVERHAHRVGGVGGVDHHLRLEALGQQRAL